LKVIIPTPLRGLCGEKKIPPKFSAQTVGEALGGFDDAIYRASQTSVHRGREIAQLRECLFERRRHSLYGQGSDASERWRRGSASFLRLPAATTAAVRAKLVTNNLFVVNWSSKPMATKTQSPIAKRRRPPVCPNEEILRYSRHLIMPEVGMEGQLKLKKRESIVDWKPAGSGAPLGLYLAAGGRRQTWPGSISTWWISPTCSGK